MQKNQFFAMFLSVIIIASAECRATYVSNRPDEDIDESYLRVIY